MSLRLHRIRLRECVYNNNLAGAPVGGACNMQPSARRIQIGRVWCPFVYVYRSLPLDHDR